MTSTILDGLRAMAEQKAEHLANQTAAAVQGLGLDSTAALSAGALVQSLALTVTNEIVDWIAAQLAAADVDAVIVRDGANFTIRWT